MQKNEYETVRVIFVGWLFVPDYLVGATDRIGDRISADRAESSSSKTRKWRVLCAEI
jgi:hypothetical protein